MRQPVTQMHDFGCGAACVAFLARKPYLQVVNLLGAEKAKTEGFYCKDLATALRIFGFSYEFRYIKPHVRKRIHQDGVIVFIKRSKSYPVGHYLARYHGRWMDPWLNLRSDRNILNAKSGFRKRLPGKPGYTLLPVPKPATDVTITVVNGKTKETQNQAIS